MVLFNTTKFRKAMDSCKYRMYRMYGCTFLANSSQAVLKADKIDIITIALKSVQEGTSTHSNRGFFTLLLLLIISIGVRICDFAQIWMFALAV